MSGNRVLFVGRIKNRQPQKNLLDVSKKLTALGLEVIVEQNIAEVFEGFAEVAQSAGATLVPTDSSSIKPDWVVVLGGDGAFLNAARRFSPTGAALIGVNLGFLGFLTDIARSEINNALPAIFSGEHHIEERFMFLVSVNGQQQTAAIAVNDAVVGRGESGVLISLSVAINNRFIYDLRADGLIIATPSGSTAYALSAGGPIIAPDLDATLLVPLCPHALTHRPLVVCADYPIEIEILQAQSATLHIDGQDNQLLSSGDKIQICRHPLPLRICHPNSYDYYQTLRKKLLWSE